MITSTIKRHVQVKFILGLLVAVAAHWPSYCAAAAPLAIDQLSDAWAKIFYQENGLDNQEADMAALAHKASQMGVDDAPDASTLIWQAIIVSSKAQMEGGIAGLRDAEEARDILLRAKELDPRALSGLVFTSLGVLYLRVPGWPIGFGDEGTAKKYLQQGLAFCPNCLDQNYFYGDYLYRVGDKVLAKTVLERGLKAPPTGSEVADEGRRKEIQDLLKKIDGNQE